MSECLGKEKRKKKKRAGASERDPAVRGHLCIKIFQTSIFDGEPADLSLKCERSEAP